jgi:hypothetical protein
MMVEMNIDARSPSVDTDHFLCREAPQTVKRASAQQNWLFKCMLKYKICGNNLFF